MRNILVLVLILLSFSGFAPKAESTIANGHILYDPVDKINYCVGSPIDCTFNGDAEEKGDTTPTTSGPGGQ